MHLIKFRYKQTILQLDETCILFVIFTFVSAGEVNIAEVMFPGGSPHLVEPIYSNAKLSAPFNEQLTEVICSYIAHRRLTLAPGEKVQYFII